MRLKAVLKFLLEYKPTSPRINPSEVQTKMTSLLSLLDLQLLIEAVIVSHDKSSIGALDHPSIELTQPLATAEVNASTSL
jgi:hypothetical protein